MNIYATYLHIGLWDYDRYVLQWRTRYKSIHGAGCIKIRALADIALSRYVRQSPAKAILGYGA